MRACVGILAAAALLTGIMSWSAAGQVAEKTPTGPVPAGPSRLLDVPYLPQSEALCGGAAAAMVMRYWGREETEAESFAPLVDAAAGGIHAGDLVVDLRRRGWRPLAFRGTLSLVRDHLDAGRPVVALIEVSPGRHHYVVVVAQTPGTVIFHDPARVPFRRMDRAEFTRRWEGGARWALLLLPPESDPRAEAGRDPDDRVDEAPPALSISEAGDTQGGSDFPKAAIPREIACAGAVREAVASARRGDDSAAEALLSGAIGQCPSFAPAHSELAGLRFRQERWRSAALRARRALSLAPADSQAAHLLGASRYMLDDELGALEAWNRVGDPRVASVRVYGLAHTPWDAVESRIPVATGSTLAPGELVLARRRVEAIPALGTATVRYRPRRDGRVDVQAAVVERPRVPISPPDLVGLGLRALTVREIRRSAASLAGAGELWEGGWRWWSGRSAWWLRASVPGALGLGAVSTAGARRTEESFLTADPGGVLGDASGRTRTVVERRSRGSLGVRRWATGSLRWGAELALDRWERHGSYLAPFGSVELRPVEGRLALRTEVGAWLGLGGQQTTFSRGAIGVAWRPVGRSRIEWTVRGGTEAVGSGAPLSLWPGAGVGHARPHLLRAHPLLEEGAITGPGFGRILAHAGTEARIWLVRLGPVRAGVGGFLDAARPWGGPVSLSGGGTLLADAGGGIRLSLAGDRGGHLRVDLAGGLTKSAGAFSVGWRTPWPGWD